MGKGGPEDGMGGGCWRVFDAPDCWFERVFFGFRPFPSHLGSNHNAFTFHGCPLDIHGIILAIHG